MTPDRGDTWAEVERLYHDLRELPAVAREAALARAAVSDDVRSEVRALLQHDADASGFLERPALEDLATELVRDHAPLPTGYRLGPYAIVGFLGAGGMGDVYRARDVRLERDVALKVIRRSEVSSDALARFDAEARAASALAHPGIVTIYSVGEDEAFAYIAMELVESETLRARLSTGRLSIDEALDIALQVAEAMVAMHDIGIVHRDLKPDNVMLAPGRRVKVLDFGLARRAPGPLDEGDALHGTAPYMAPEQIAGGVVDHRADQFAFGALLYELLTGRRAFTGGSLAATLEAVRTGTPEPVQRLNADVPGAVRDIIHRCLQKTADDRYASTSALAEELRNAREVWRRVDGTRRGRRRVWWASGAALLAAGVGSARWLASAGGARVESIAVLPFVNEERRPDIDYLCDGLTESVLRQLCWLPNLDVAPRSAVFNFKAPPSDVRETGRRLGVSAVVAGSVRVEAGRLRVHARIVEVADGRERWREEYSRALGDALGLQHELARAIASDGIRASFDRDATRRFAQPVTAEPEAYDAYLRALYQFRRPGEVNYRDARVLLEAAVAKDPSFALALVSLASTYSVMTIDGYEPAVEAWPASNRAIRRALEVDPGLADAHAEQSASWFFFDHDWTAAESAWKRSLGSPATPTMPDLLAASALKLWALGRGTEALAMADRARALDPVTPRFAMQHADLLLHLGKADDALASYLACVAEHPEAGDVYFGLAEAYRVQGDYGRALTARRQGHALRGVELPAPSDVSDREAYLGLCRAEAEAELAALSEHALAGGYVSALESGRARARLGDPRGALRDLEAAFEERAPGLTFLRVDPAWDSVRDDRQFQAAVARVGLP